MPAYQYIHNNWPEPKRAHEAGRVNGVGSFPRDWLGSQDAKTLAEWGITKTVIEDASPSLAEVKATAKRKVTAWKVAKQDENITHDGVEFQNEERSRQMILGSLAMAQLNKAMTAANPGTPLFSINWTAADDSSVTMNADEMIAFAITSGQAVEAIHRQAQAAKQQIDAASDTASVQSVLDGLS